MIEEVILIFDIGKTNKKVLLFDSSMTVILEEETKFPETVDDDGFPCDDIEKLEAWIKTTLYKYLNNEKYSIVAVNFATYGATLMYTDEKGHRLTPIYNYLNPLEADVVEDFLKNYGGVDEFSRKTASPYLGMMNSGIQIVWLKQKKPQIYGRVHSIMHFPQYMSYLFSGEVVSEHTSIGCHTSMWDFDKMEYHKWLKDENIKLPVPISAEKTFNVKLENKQVNIGIGMHDSSASLVPYLKGSEKKFILVSTGTWCISMNPYNHTPLTDSELVSDCLCYMSIDQKPVKSSRFFLGYIHDENLKQLVKHFKVKEDQHKFVQTNEDTISRLFNSDNGNGLFFKEGVPANYIDENVDLNVFSDFDEAYHQLMIDLTWLVHKSIQLIIPEQDNTECLYISGGFAKNTIFTSLLATLFKNKEIFTSEVGNATSLGAALVLSKHFESSSNLDLDLGLKKAKAFEINIPSRLVL